MDFILVVQYIFYNKKDKAAAAMAAAVPVIPKIQTLMPTKLDVEEYVEASILRDLAAKPSKPQAPLTPRSLGLMTIVLLIIIATTTPTSYNVHELSVSRQLYFYVCIIINNIMM